MNEQWRIVDIGINNNKMLLLGIDKSIINYDNDSISMYIILIFVGR